MKATLGHGRFGKHLGRAGRFVDHSGFGDSPDLGSDRFMLAKFIGYYGLLGAAAVSSLFLR